MLIVEVDDLDAEPLEARLACGADIGRIALNAQELAIRSAHVAELRREEHLIAAVADRSPDQLLVLADAVHVGGVEEIHAAVDRMMDGRDQFRSLPRP